MEEKVHGQRKKGKVIAVCVDGKHYERLNEGEKYLIREVEGTPNYVEVFSLKGDKIERCYKKRFKELIGDELCLTFKEVLKYGSEGQTWISNSYKLKMFKDAFELIPIISGSKRSKIIISDKVLFKLEERRFSTTEAIMKLVEGHKIKSLVSGDAFIIDGDTVTSDLGITYNITDNFITTNEFNGEWILC